VFFFVDFWVSPKESKIKYQNNKNKKNKQQNKSTTKNNPQTTTAKKCVFFQTFKG